MMDLFNYRRLILGLFGSVFGLMFIVGFTIGFTLGGLI